MRILLVAVTLLMASAASAETFWLYGDGARPVAPTDEEPQARPIGQRMIVVPGTFAGGSAVWDYTFQADADVMPMKARFVLEATAPTAVGPDGTTAAQNVCAWHVAVWTDEGPTWQACSDQYAGSVLGEGVHVVEVEWDAGANRFQAGAGDVLHVQFSSHTVASPDGAETLHLLTAGPDVDTFIELDGTDEAAAILPAGGGGPSGAQVPTDPTAGAEGGAGTEGPGNTDSPDQRSSLAGAALVAIGLTVAAVWMARRREA